MAVGKIYVAERFDSSSKVNVFDMASNMVDQFKLMMNSVTWMDEASKKMANEKVNFNCCYRKKQMKVFLIMIYYFTEK